ncbi:rRNA methyltransferase 1, mitochondrial [Microcaecilia unicolor]|uniref:rRNA methyltransferase 1, mitochondrial n=1 Tax=Microcaecilia unicolor TaxID=1415580 RepID=A0A6P7WUK3_9AMPH|nr:rRNA methyltransferase 1, mitochondrial [Microcaecilia unicolor]
MTCAGTVWNWPYCIWKANRLSLALNNKFRLHSVRQFCVKGKPRQSELLDANWIKGDARVPDDSTLQISEGLQNPRRKQHSATSSQACEPQHIERTCSASELYLKNSHKLMNVTRKNLSSRSREKTSEFRLLRDDDFVKKRRKVCKEGARSDKKHKHTEILFGIAPCYMALMQSRRTFLKLFLKSTRSRQRPEVEAACQQAQACNVPVQFVSRKMLDALCEGHVHQGLCMEVSPLHYLTFEETLDSESPNEMCLNQQLLWLVLDGLLDPMNLGAVLRSAYFLGVDKVITSQGNSCPLTPVVSKASAGAMEVMEVYSTSSLQEFLKAKIKQGWQVIGTTGKSDTVGDDPVISCSEFLWEKPTLLVLGNEGRGISPEIRSLCHYLLTIPPGREIHMALESLNVSVAAGICLHQICSQRIK